MQNLPAYIHRIPVQEINRRNILLGHQPEQPKATKLEDWEIFQENAVKALAELTLKLGPIDTITPINGHVGALDFQYMTIGYIITLSLEPTKK